MTYPRLASFRTAAAFRSRLSALGLVLPCDDGLATPSPLAAPYTLRDGRRIGNRLCAHPMEGWDGTPDGRPTALTLRRWTNFGRSGAKLIWGGEAVAVRADGRANPHQLLITPATLTGLAELRAALLAAHRDAHGTTADLLLGLQLTHSGRFARPNDRQRLEPKILYHHPLLDGLFHLDAALPVLSDLEIDDLIGDFVRAGAHAWRLGFDFVDLKHCHGYLGHEFLSARTRPGRYGGDLENRMRFLREVTAGLRRDAPGLRLGVRVSAFDSWPFRPGPDGVGRPETWRDEHGLYPFAFGADPADPLKVDLAEPLAFLRELEALGIELVSLTAGSPYYNPHLQRPALFPPSDGYQPPEDPLAGVARQISAAAALKAAHPGLAVVGAGYSYLQEWLPHVAQAVVRAGQADFVGLGRLLLAYPDFPADLLAGRPLQRKRLCRTFSDCTTAPRRGLVSGCYPLDEFYRARPEAAQLKRAGAAQGRAGPGERGQ